MKYIVYDSIHDRFICNRIANRDWRVEHFWGEPPARLETFKDTARIISVVMQLTPKEELNRIAGYVAVPLDDDWRYGDEVDFTEGIMLDELLAERERFYD